MVETISFVETLTSNKITSLSIMSPAAPFTNRADELWYNLISNYTHYKVWDEITHPFHVVAWFSHYAWIIWFKITDRSLYEPNLRWKHYPVPVIFEDNKEIYQYFTRQESIIMHHLQNLIE